MIPWTFPLRLEPAAAEPIYLQIARAISGDIRRGRLRPGAALPGSRSLALTLGVHRNTVLAALRELAAEGWIATAQRSTRVAEDLPQPAAPVRTPLPGGLGFALEAGPAPVLPSPGQVPGLLVFGGGLPDLRLVPADLLGRAYRRALRHRPLLGYGDPRGEARLRAALAGMLSEARGLAGGPDQVMVTGGSQMALDLVARALLRPGDRVAVEHPGYPPAWAILRAAGAELVPVPVDEAGLQVEALAALLAERPIRALYCTPHHHFPTTVTLPPGRRMALLDLARRHRMAILEDDYDFEFHFDGSPVLPLASADQAGVVVYMGTLSKVLAPGLRLGFVAGPQALVEALARRRYLADHQGDQVLERAVADLLEDGLLQRHVRKMRRVYHVRRDALGAALAAHLGGATAFELPAGGMSLWLRTDPAIDVEAWARRAERKGVVFHPGRLFDFFGNGRPGMRLGFTALNEGELLEAVRRMSAAL